MVRHTRSDYNARFQDLHGIFPHDEPIFILRAKDLAGPPAVEAWASLAEARGAEAETVQRVREWAQEMRAWAEHNGGAKVPDTPKELLVG